MILGIKNHKFQYEAEKLTRVFYPNEKITVVIGDSFKDGEALLLTEFTDSEVRVVFTDEAGNVLYSEENSLSGVSDGELLMAQMMFRALVKITGYTPKWGILTGIRPSKLLRNLKATYGDEKGKEIFMRDYLVTREKTALADSVANTEEKIISLSRPESFSLYVSIPFCPTRCSYCSFVSHAMTSSLIKKLMPDYLDCLKKEIEITGKIAKSLGLRLESVYYGGGTPTTLEADELKYVIEAISDNFDLSTVREYTIEAGRPDTLTREKFKVMKNGGVSRISINPQTFDDKILEAIGRKHTAQMAENAFYIAREEGFDNINADLIAGLPNDTLDGFCASLDKALSFSAENITVHTLALKRSSVMGTTSGQVDTEKSRLAGSMLDYAYSELTGNGYFPYYMYRQAKSLGNLENTGYSKPDRECLYNIFMMEECHSVFALGGGGVTRLKAPNGDKISRIFNYKYPYEYIDDFAEIVKRKDEIIKFYDSCK